MAKISVRPFLVACRIIKFGMEAVTQDTTFFHESGGSSTKAAARISLKLVSSGMLAAKACRQSPPSCKACSRPGITCRCCAVPLNHVLLHFHNGHGLTSVHSHKHALGFRLFLHLKQIIPNSATVFKRFSIASDLITAVPASVLINVPPKQLCFIQHPQQGTYFWSSRIVRTNSRLRRVAA